MTSFRTTWLSMAAAALLSATAARAHDMVLIPEAGGRLTVRYGHPGDWQQADRERLLELDLLSPAGAATPLAAGLVTKGLNLETTAAVATATPALAAARYDNGLWVTTPGADGKPVWHNASRAMVPNATSSTMSLKYAKGLFGSADDAALYKREVGHLIELVPQRNPAAVKAGDTLAVLVKLQGRPLANAAVELTDASTQTTEGQAKYRTDARGIAQVPIRQGGLNVISVDHEQPNNGSLGKAFKAIPVDKVLMIATYAFRI